MEVIDCAVVTGAVDAGERGEAVLVAVGVDLRIVARKFRQQARTFPQETRFPFAVLFSISRHAVHALIAYPLADTSPKRVIIKANDTFRLRMTDGLMQHFHQPVFAVVTVTPVVAEALPPVVTAQPGRENVPGHQADALPDEEQRALIMVVDSFVTKVNAEKAVRKSVRQR